MSGEPHCELCGAELWQDAPVTAADPPLNAVQQQVQAAFLKLTESAIAAYFNDVQASKADALKTFGTQIVALRKAKADATEAAK